MNDKVEFSVSICRVGMVDLPELCRPQTQEAAGAIVAALLGCGDRNIISVTVALIRTMG